MNPFNRTSCLANAPRAASQGDNAFSLLEMLYGNNSERIIVSHHVYIPGD